MGLQYWNQSDDATLVNRPQLETGWCVVQGTLAEMNQRREQQ